MPIWSAEIKELEKLNESLGDRFPELEKELVSLINTDDENVALLYSRRCLEVIITDLCECELKRSRGTEPLKGIIDKLQKEEKVTSHIIASMHGLNTLSTFGTHPKDFDPEQVKPVLNNLATIIKWYLKYKIPVKDIKAKPAEEIRQEIKISEETKKSIWSPKKRLIGLISGIILLVVIVVPVLFFTKIIGGGKQTIELEKSIAVLPFRNDSPDSTNKYFIDGTMEAILNNLCKVKDLIVVSRTSVEQFRNTTRPIHEIAKRLNVNYILEGSGQKYGNNIRLTVQLIDAVNDRHIWSSPYEGVADNIFKLQSQISEAIASELKAIISPDEKQLIEKTPTTSLTAHDFYLRGKEEQRKYSLNDTSTWSALERATNWYKKALEYDPDFAQAYTGLSRVYWDKHYFKDFFSGNFQDSAIVLCDMALSLDHQLSEAYTLKGTYYSEIGNSEQALEELDKAIQYNPNDWMAYYGKGTLYSTVDLVKSIDNFQKAASLNRGEQLPELLRSSIGWEYMLAGFPEKAYYYWKEALVLDGDSAKYYLLLAINEFYCGNYEKSIKYIDKVYSKDSIDIKPLIFIGLALNHIFISNYEVSLKYINKYLELLESLKQTDISNTWIVGYIYFKNGNKEKAAYFFDETIKNSNRMIDLGRAYAQAPEVYYDLAGIYAFRGETDKAFKNLRIFSQKPCVEIKWGTLLKNDPLFNSIRSEPKFQQIVRAVEAKYQAEHERVRKWLEGQGML
jgi:TolB-like protein